MEARARSLRGTSAAKHAGAPPVGARRRDPQRRTPAAPGRVRVGPGVCRAARVRQARPAHGVLTRTGSQRRSTGGRFPGPGGRAAGKGRGAPCRRGLPRLDCADRHRDPGGDARCPDASLGRRHGVLRSPAASCDKLHVNLQRSQSRDLDKDGATGVQGRPVRARGPRTGCALASGKRPHLAPAAVTAPGLTSLPHVRVTVCAEETPTAPATRKWKQGLKT